jgi:hypothetical protein
MKVYKYLAAAALVVVTGAVAQSSAAQAEDTPPSIVEDFAYPGADHITGVKLIKGDGHIVLADCGADPNLPPEDLILVQTSKVGNPDETNFCFKATGTSGYLTMELDEVYFIRGDGDRTVAAKVEVQDATPVTETEEVEPGEWQPVGVGQSRGTATLLEIRYPFAS